MAALEWEGFWRRIDWLGMYVLKCWLSPVWIILAARHLQNLVGNWAVWVAWGLPLRQDVESICYRVLFLPFILSGFSLVKAACCRDFTHPPAPNKTLFSSGDWNSIAVSLPNLWKRVSREVFKGSVHTGVCMWERDGWKSAGFDRQIICRYLLCSRIYFIL